MKRIGNHWKSNGILGKRPTPNRQDFCESDEIPAAAEEELPAAELPSKPFIDDAAEQAGLSLAEKIFLELKWHVGFQPVGVPLESGPAFLRKNY